MADPRRRTLATSGSHNPGVPSSIPRPTTSLRQSMAPSTSTSALNASTAAASSNRHSLAPSGMGMGIARSSMRNSIAPSASMGMGVGVGVPGSSQESQQSQLFSQGHGGPPATANGGNGNQTTMTIPSTVGRQGHYLSSASASMSVGKSGILTAPLSERRSTTGMRRSTVGSVANTPSGNRHLPPRVNRDPRAEKEWRAANQGYKLRWATEIISFLNAHSFPSQIELKVLATNSTANMFKDIFKFLINKFDEGYLWSGNLKSFIEEVPVALRSVGYPFGDSITKSHLQSVGSSQNWANFLAMLHWLVVTIENRTAAFENCQELHMPLPATAPELEDAPFEVVIEHAWIEFVGDTYPKFLASEDFDNVPELDQFNARLEAGRESLRSRVADLEDDNAALTKELAELESTPDELLALQARKEAFDRDRVKIANYLEKSTNRLEAAQNALKEKKLQKEEMLQDRESNASQIHQLTKLVEAQGMTPVEISQITTERASLTKINDALNKRTQTILEKTLSLEIEVANALTRSESLINDYTLKAELLNILPTPPDGYEDVNFHQEISGAVAPPLESLLVLKPTLVELKGKAKVECEKLNDDDVSLEQNISRNKEEIAELRETVEADEGELEELKKEDITAREADKVEDTREKAENGRLQSSVDQLKATMGHALAAAQWRFDQRLQERTKMLQDSDEVRRINRTELESAIEEIMKYKEYMMEQTSKLVDLSKI